MVGVDKRGTVESPTIYYGSSAGYFARGSLLSPGKASIQSTYAFPSGALRLVTWKVGIDDTGTTEAVLYSDVASYYASSYLVYLPTVTELRKLFDASPLTNFDVDVTLGSSFDPQLPIEIMEHAAKTLVLAISVGTRTTPLAFVRGRIKGGAKNKIVFTVTRATFVPTFSKVLSPIVYVHVIDSRSTVQAAYASFTHP
jgi:hypothetical protein